MTTNRSAVRLLAVATALILLAGCKVSGNRRAPIEDRNSPVKQSQAPERKTLQRQQDSDSRFHVVQKGDTLYSIAFDNGLDYREVAEQNNIEDPSSIHIGQQIKLAPSQDLAGERPRIDSKPLPASPSAPIARKDQPKIAKLPYSPQAVAQIEKMQQEPDTQPVVVAVAVPAVKPVQEPDSGSDDGLEWGIPTKGKVVGEFSESANRKGVDIAGTKGQPVLASAAGKVVYSGSGLRGYGKLVIIKHNKTFLSAYAHNEQILVKEGQNVTRGQKIAEMGNTDADQVKLHFEIRKFGKPVDPSKFLNLGKS